MGSGRNTRLNEVFLCSFGVLQPLLKCFEAEQKKLRLLYLSFDKEFSNFRTHSSFFSKQTLVESCISITILVLLVLRHLCVCSLRDYK